VSDHPGGYNQSTGERNGSQWGNNHDVKNSCRYPVLTFFDEGEGGSKKLEKGLLRKNTDLYQATPG